MTSPDTDILGQSCVKFLTEHFMRLRKLNAVVYFLISPRLLLDAGDISSSNYLNKNINPKHIIVISLIKLIFKLLSPICA